MTSKYLTWSGVLNEEDIVVKYRRYASVPALYTRDMECISPPEPQYIEIVSIKDTSGCEIELPVNIYNMLEDMLYRYEGMDI